jgi:hypothetical protein
MVLVVVGVLAALALRRRRVARGGSVSAASTAIAVVNGVLLGALAGFILVVLSTALLGGFAQ